MIMLSVSLVDETENGTLHSEVEQIHIGYNGDGQNPDPEGNITQTVHDKWRQEERYRHIGDGPDPIREHVSSNVPYAQLQVDAPPFEPLVAAGRRQQ